MQLSVIIPTYNGSSLLKQSLPCLLSALHSVSSYEIIVVDNGSTDDTIGFIKRAYPAIIYVLLPTNFGFAGAVNHASQQAKGTYVLILNNDCFLNRQTITRMIRFLKVNPEYIMTQPVIYKMTGILNGIHQNKEVEHVGYMVDLYVGRARMITDPNHVPKKRKKNMWESRYLYGLSGTCLLIRGEMLKKISLFDKSFHSYLEDVDLCIRLTKLGYSYYPTLSTSANHIHMATAKKMGMYKEIRDLSNWFRIIVKNYPLTFILKHVVSLSLERGRNMSGVFKRVIALGRFLL